MGSEFDSLVQRAWQINTSAENQALPARANQAHGHYRGLDAVWDKLEKNCKPSADISTSGNIRGRRVNDILKKLDL